ncbi:MAG: Ig-like domain-containing protein, partial [Chitinophagaceae bacterium]
MIFRDILFALVVLLSVCVFSIISPGCGQIISPTGGPRDSIPPLLISASPANGTINFKANRITLNFNEYISLEQLQENLIVSPTPFSSPYIDYKLKTVTIKLRDTLQANTTYTINLGNSIRDLNESNPLGDFRYIFSTGSVIDTLNFSGNVILAESGNTDSTMLALLYKDLDDSAVYKRKAAYISRLDAKGNFTFRNLPGGTFRLFAIKDRDNGRTYNSPLEVFAFSDTLIRVSENTTPVLMYAYAEQREGSTASTSRAPS